MAAQRKRKDVCKVCGGPVWVLAWAKKKPRQCHGCYIRKQEAKHAKATS